MGKDLEKRLETKRYKLYNLMPNTNNMSPEQRNKIYAKNNKIYGGAKDISKLLDAEKKNISKDSVAEFIFDCAMYSVHNPSQRIKINKLIESDFMEYKGTYFSHVLSEVFNGYTREYWTEKAGRLKKVQELIEKIEKRQEIPFEFYHEQKFDMPWKFNS